LPSLFASRFLAILKSGSTPFLTGDDTGISCVQKRKAGRFKGVIAVAGVKDKRRNETEMK
jgi:hypothetical protein